MTARSRHRASSAQDSPHPRATDPLLRRRAELAAGRRSPTGRRRGHRGTCIRLGVRRVQHQARCGHPHQESTAGPALHRQSAVGYLLRRTSRAEIPGRPDTKDSDRSYPAEKNRPASTTTPNMGSRESYLRCHYRVWGLHRTSPRNLLRWKARESSPPAIPVMATRRPEQAPTPAASRGTTPATQMARQRRRHRNMEVHMEGTVHPPPQGP